MLVWLLSFPGEDDIANIYQLAGSSAAPAGIATKSIGLPYGRAESPSQTVHKDICRLASMYSTRVSHDRNRLKSPS
jgi:hypothetical protein